MSRGTAYEGFAALYDGSGNTEKIVTERIGTKVVVEYELVKSVQMALNPNGAFGPQASTWRGDPLGRFPDIPEYPQIGALKEKLIDQTKEFVRQIAFQGYVPITNYEQFSVWGPYTEKVGEPTDFVPEADNHTMRADEKKTATSVWGYQGDELDISKGCAFQIYGMFARPAILGQVEELTGRIIV